ncbi:MAG: imidazolonepropionase [Chloroherpetonaceae bacterium]
MASLLIHNASQIATAAGRYVRGADMNRARLHEHTSIYIQDGIICAIGSPADLERSLPPASQILDATNCTVIPGLIDAHTHLVFAGTREKEFALRLSGATYQDIASQGGGILSTVQATRNASKTDLKSIAKHYLSLALAHGTTTMEIKTGYGLNEETELLLLNIIEELNSEQPITLVPTFLGAHAFPPDFTKSEYLTMLHRLLPHVATKAKFIDAFVEENYFSLKDTEQLCLEAKRYGLLPRLHVNQLSSNGGVKLGLQLGAVSLDHLEKISDEEIQLLAQSETVAMLLPCVSLFLGYGYPPARRLIDSGAITAIASNFNPGSAMNLNMQLVMFVACAQMSLSPFEALTAATLNAAYSLGLSDKLGTIEIGKQADLVILDTPNFEQAIYFFGINHSKTIIKNGVVVWTR